MAKKRSTAITPAYLGRRAEIAAAAARLFGAAGVNPISMEDIAEAVGLAKPSLYHYFKTRDEILYAIHEQTIGFLTRRFIARQAAGALPPERLRGAIGDAFDLVNEMPGFSRVIFEHLRHVSPPFREQIRANQAEYTARIQGIFEDGIASGDFRPIDPHLATLALLGMVNWSHQWYSSSGTASPEQLTEQFFSYFMHGVAAADGDRSTD